MTSLSQRSSESSEKEFPGAPGVSAALASKAEASGEGLGTITEHRIGLQPVH